jgi:hypothetical protein
MFLSLDLLFLLVRIGFYRQQFNHLDDDYVDRVGLRLRTADIVGPIFIPR